MQSLKKIHAWAQMQVPLCEYCLIHQFLTCFGCSLRHSVNLPANPTRSTGVFAAAKSSIISFPRISVS